MWIQAKQVNNGPDLLIRQLFQKNQEYNKELLIIFVDFQLVV